MSSSLPRRAWKHRCLHVTASCSAQIPHRYASSASSNAWLSRQSRDPFVKQRNEDSFRARSVYKLDEINQKYRFLQKAQVVVDLGAAPGGWSEYVSHIWRDRLNLTANPPNDSTVATEGRGRRERTPTQKKPIILAVDLLLIEPIQGVTTLKGNFLSKEVYDRLQGHLRGHEVDVVLSDMCGNASGNRDHDIASSFELCKAALIFAQREFARCVPRGPHRGARKTLVYALSVITIILPILIRPPHSSMKFFTDPEFDVFRRTCQEFFNRVEVFKPKSSRSDSSESYLVCMGYRDAGAPTKDMVYCKKPKKSTSNANAK